MMKTDLPQGFMAGAVGANFKKAGRDDLGVIFSDCPCVLAALFTRNLFCAAPVQVDRQILESGENVRAIVANSGQANACTGQTGLDNCREIQQTVAKCLHINPGEVLLLSTGVIGARFDMQKWHSAIPGLIQSIGSKDAEGFTRSFMTTDAFPKFSTTRMNLSGGEVRLAVMAKGAGMICPNMATMLCVALTDAVVERDVWQDIFNQAVNATFNRVTVDGDTSTNDTILGLANGASGVTLKTTEDRLEFEGRLTEILGRVARMLVQDGEGARKIMNIQVSGAANDRDAEIVARSVGNSQLVKTAIYGGDANWGRIINAVGYSGVEVTPADVCLELCGIERFRSGQPVNDDKEADLAQALQSSEIPIRITLGHGPGSFSLLASDLGHEYVSLNADYRS